MDKPFNSVEFEYEFTTDRDSIPFDLRNSPTVALRVEGILTIKINNDIYFQADIALLEFYLYLLKWGQTNKKGRDVQEFKYYSLEFDEDEAIISLLPFGNSARLASIWEVNKLYNVFELNYIVQKLTQLTTRLGKDIENHYDIQMNTFIGKVPIKG
ncbi:DUF7878 domain-containing protein [Peribacillus frigoritolerans]